MVLEIVERGGILTLMTQETALSILKTGANVFLTGEPGSGKTHTINTYIEYLKDHGVEPAVTASTGIAATHIGGMTLHSFCGIGVKEQLTPYDLEELGQKERLVRRAQKTEVLIIEEVSMLDARVIDMADKAMQILRSDTRPFGGSQVVFVGDFYQLPPIARNNTAVFAFESRSWSQVKPVTCYLSEQHRQVDDVFLGVLSSIRNREVAYGHRKSLSERRVQHEALTEVTATRLFSHNADVDRINIEELNKINGYKKKYDMTAKGSKSNIEQLKRGCLSPECLELKEGAVVMFTKNNFERGYVNGTIGVVEEFNASGMPLVKTHAGEYIDVEAVDWNMEEGGKIRAIVTQLPLRLAWAITVHKSQGMSMDTAVVDLSRAFEYGQGYVALSRVRTLEGLYLLGINERALEVHPSVSEKDKWFKSHSEVAEQRFTALETDEIQLLHKNFITSVGGTMEKQSRKKETSYKYKGDTHKLTADAIKEGKSITQIAHERGLAPATVFTHVEKLVDDKKLTAKDIKHLKDERVCGIDDMEEIQAVFKKLGTEKLTPVYKHFKEKYEYNDLRLARLFMKSK